MKWYEKLLLILGSAQVNGHLRWHRLTYRDLYKQLASAVSEKGFREPNRVLNTAN